MKYLKVVGLAAAMALGLAIFSGAGSASATELTCTNPPGTKVICPAGTTIHATAETGGSQIIKAGFATFTCTQSTFHATTSNAGSSTETVKGVVNAWTFSGCNSTVTVTKAGSLEIHTQAEGANNNGTLTGSELEIDVTALGTSCTYKTEHLDIGVLTGSSTTGSTATIDISAELAKILGGFLCANPAHWEGNYTVTAPDWLNVD